MSAKPSRNVMEEGRTPAPKLGCLPPLRPWLCGCRVSRALAGGSLWWPTSTTCRLSKTSHENPGQSQILSVPAVRSAALSQSHKSSGCRSCPNCHGFPGHQAFCYTITISDPFLISVGAITKHLSNKQTCLMALSSNHSRYFIPHWTHMNIMNLSISQPIPGGVSPQLWSSPVQEDVGGLQIPVHDPHGMQMGQAQKQLPQQALHLRHGETLLGDEDLEPQRLSDCGALASGQHTKKKPWKITIMLSHCL